MILVDTGPLVALFDPKEPEHLRTVDAIKSLGAPSVTTVPVLTEALYLLGPDSRGSAALRQLVVRGGLRCWFFNEKSLSRAFDLMEEYADHPMDLADASLVAAAEALRTTRVLTIDRRDFQAYRAKIGRTLRAFDLLDPTQRVRE